MKRYRVRFHLAKGDDYMKWQVFDKKNNRKQYFEPDLWSIEMIDCELGNYPTTAKKIHDGANKTVCAWVSCDDFRAWRVEVLKPSIDGLTHYKYNPRKNPHWFTDTHNNRDGMKFKTMITDNRAVYG